MACFSFFREPRGGPRPLVFFAFKSALVDEHLQRECLEAVVFRKLLCLICLKPPRDEMRLPCDHSFCAGD